MAVVAQELEALDGWAVGGERVSRVPSDWWLGGYLDGSVCDLDKVAPAVSRLGVLEAGVKWAPARGSGRGARKHARFMRHLIGFL